PLLLSVSRCLLSCLTRPPPPSTLFPYTTLFRSAIGIHHVDIPRDAVRRVTVGHEHDAPVRRPVGVGVGGAGVLGQVGNAAPVCRSEEHTSELQSRENLVCRLLLEKKKKHNAADD